jgi:hypothetical protein
MGRSHSHLRSTRATRQFSLKWRDLGALLAERSCFSQRTGGSVEKDVEEHQDSLVAQLGNVVRLLRHGLHVGRHARSQGSYIRLK